MHRVDAGSYKNSSSKGDLPVTCNSFTEIGNTEEPDLSIKEKICVNERCEEIGVGAVRAVCRFHKNGNIFKYRLPRRHLNVTPDLESKLCSYELLYEMRCLPLARRITIVRQRYDVDLSPSALG